MVYVRTEQRAGADAPEHLFVGANRRTIFTHWTPSVPGGWELVNDHEGRVQAKEARAELWVAEQEREMALGIVKQACAWLPLGKVQELRERWRRAQP